MAREGVFFHIDERADGLSLWLSGGAEVRVRFNPYFYVPSDRVDQKTESKLRSRAVRVEKVRGLDPWSPQEFLKVVARDEDDRRQLAKLVPEAWECSIPPWHQYLLEERLAPFSAVETSSDGIKVVGEGSLEDLTILYFSGLIYSEDGFPIRGKSPVLAIGYAVDDEKPEVIASDDDAEVLGQFVELVKRADPDVIVGFGQDADEFQHMASRANLTGVKLALGRDGSEIQETGRFFRGIILVEQRIVGRANIDLFSLAWRDFPQLPTKSWYELADELGIDHPKPVPKFRIAEKWKTSRDDLLAYLREKVLVVRTLAEKLLPHQAELAKLTWRHLYEVTRTPVGGLVESLALIHGKAQGWIFPPTGREGGRFPGGYVWLKAPGLYDKIGYLDFKSMYPSIMILHNISPETVEPKEGSCSTEEVSAEGITKRVCRDRRGLFSSLAEELLRRRAEVKKEMKKSQPGSPEYRRLDAIQKAIKVVTNAMYGYMGWEGASLRNVDAAELTAALGRHYIKKVIKLIEKRGFQAVYVDTDGVQVLGGEPKDYEDLAEWLNQQIPLTIELQYVAERGLYLTKKKYAHLVGGKLVAKGFEFIRRDYPPVVKRAQEVAVRMALEGRPLAEIEKKLQEIRKALQEGRVEKEDLIIIETLGKKLEEFERKTKGFVAGKWLEDNRGIEIHRGQVLRILIVKGEGSVNERARPAEFFDVEDCDLNYYLKMFDQVVERTLQALKGVGVSEGKRGLEEFF